MQRMNEQAHANPPSHASVQQRCPEDFDEMLAPAYAGAMVVLIAAAIVIVAITGLIIGYLMA